MEWEYTFLQHIVVIWVSHNIQCRELVASFPGSHSRKGEREPGNEARELEGSVMGKLLLCMHTVHDLHGRRCGKQQHGSGNHESHYLDLVHGPNGGSLGGLSCRRYRLSPHYRGGLENEAIPFIQGNKVWHTQGVFEALHTKSKQHCLGFCLTNPDIPTISYYTSGKPINHLDTPFPSPILQPYTSTCRQVVVHTVACAGHVH